MKHLSFVTKYLSLVPVAIFSIALQSPAAHASQTVAQAGQTANTAVSVPAELTKKIDARKAKVGNEVTAVITTDTKLPDGTELPKGTKLVGTVTSVPGKANSDHLAFDFDRAVLHNGQTVLVHTALTSMAGSSAAPATTTADASTGSPAASSDSTANLESGTRMTLDVSSRRQ
jgi:hypothetical protein